MKSSWVSCVSRKSNDEHISRYRRGYRKDVQVKTEAKTESTKVAEKCMELSETRRGKKDSPLVSSGTVALRTLDYRLWPPEICDNKLELF